MRPLTRQAVGISDTAGNSRTLADPASDGTGDVLAGLTWMTFWMIGVYLLAVSAMTVVLDVLALVLGAPASWLLNRLVWTSVRQSARGDDILKEDVGAIAAHPAEFVDPLGPLPDSVADPLRQHSEKRAIVTLHKVGQVLGMSPQSRSSADLRTELSENLKWQELIHTSYFDVPEFVDLIAVGLHARGLGELRQGFGVGAARRNHPQALQAVQELQAWCNGANKPAAVPLVA